MEYHSLTHFSCSVMSDSLRRHESQHSRHPCPSSTPEFTQTHVHQVGDAIRPSHSCRTLLLLPPIPPISGSFPMSQLCMRWPKYWSFSFSISLSKEHQGLISFRMDWLDLLAESQESSPTPQFKSINFFSTQPSSQSNSHIHT